VQAVPGVRKAGLASMIPLGGNVDMYSVRLEDRGEANPADDPSALRYAVTPDYIETMGIPVVEGRALTASDNEAAPPVVLINEAAAARLFPSGQAVGKRLRMGGGENGPLRTVVGVVGSTKHRSLDDAAEMQVYLPTTQWGEEAGLTLVVHTNVRSSSVVPSVRAALRGVARDIAITNVATLERLVNTRPPTGGLPWCCSPASRRSR
jgi:putative ABC transport system permease protein